MYITSDTLVITYNVMISNSPPSSIESMVQTSKTQMYTSYIYYKNKNWLQFLFTVKAAVLKQQISKFYPQIQLTEASDHIYFSQRPFINVTLSCDGVVVVLRCFVEVCLPSCSRRPKCSAVVVNGLLATSNCLEGITVNRSHVCRPINRNHVAELTKA